MIPLLALWRLAGGIPWQVYALIAAFAALALYGCQQRQIGEDAAKAIITKSNEAARSRADEASRTVENCTGTWDRARGVCLSDVRPGR